MSWHDGAGILEPHRTLDSAFAQVAQHARQTANQAEKQALPYRDIHTRNRKENAPERHGDDQSGDEPFPALVRRCAWSKFMLAEFRPEHICPRVVEPNACEYDKHENATPNPVNRHANEQKPSELHADVESAEHDPISEHGANTRTSTSKQA